MAYVAPSTVTTLQTYTSSAHNIIVNDIIDIDARVPVNSGLVLLNTTSFTTATTVNLDYLSATYDRYRLIVSGLGSSSGSGLLFKLRTSGGTQSTAYYSGSVQGTSAGTGNYTWTYGQNTSSITLLNINTSYQGLCSFDISNVNNSSYPNITGTLWDWYAVGAAVTVSGSRAATATYTGIELSAGTGTITGTAKLYGYRNS